MPRLPRPRPARGDLALTPVRGRADTADFIDLPHRLHPSTSPWVPPLRSEQRALLDRRKNPFFDYGNAELFLVRKHGRPVGRVAAVDNPRSNAHHGTREGFFGLFESINDVTVARALFDAAAQWLQKRELRTMTGPVGFTTNDECGVLVDGYELPPAVMLPYNPPYYPDLLETVGLAKAKDLLAWELPATVHQDQRLERAARHVQEQRKLSVRPVDLSRFKEETELFRQLYNSTLDDNWGFCPLTRREMESLARRLRPVISPDLAVIGESDGDPVGFALAVPDIAPALAAAGGRLWSYGLPLGGLRALRAQRSISRGRFIALGVCKENRRQGLELLMYRTLSQAAQARGLHTGELSWVLEDNRHVNAAAARLGGRIVKRYRLYSGSLALQKAAHHTTASALSAGG